MPFQLILLKLNSWQATGMGSSASDIMDDIHVRPGQKDAQGHVVPARFDTALVQSGSIYRVVQYRCLWLSHGGLPDTKQRNPGYVSIPQCV